MKMFLLPRYKETVASMWFFMSPNEGNICWFCREVPGIMIMGDQKSND